MLGIPLLDLEDGGRGRGRRRGGPGSASTPRLALASFSAQIASGFAAAQARSDDMERRLRHLGAATPRPREEAVAAEPVSAGADGKK